MSKKFIVFCVILFGIANCYAKVSVGEPLDGGTVFCVTDDPDLTKCKTTGSGDFGLIMSNEDLVDYKFNKPNKVINWSPQEKKTYATSDDDGITNTLYIIKAHPDDKAKDNAAWLCYNYQVNQEPETKKEPEGWYLPSKNELNKMYEYVKVNNLIGNNCSGKKQEVQYLVDSYWPFFWSSTEYSGRSAWYEDFSDGTQNPQTKLFFAFRVRAVRVFNSLTLKPLKTLEDEYLYGKQQRKQDLIHRKSNQIYNKYKLMNHQQQILAISGSPEALLKTQKTEEIQEQAQKVEEIQEQIQEAKEMIATNEQNLNEKSLNFFSCEYYGSGKK